MNRARCARSVLTGVFVGQAGPVDVGGVLREVDDARAEDAARRLRLQARH